MIKANVQQYEPTLANSIINLSLPAPMLNVT